MGSLNCPRQINDLKRWNCVSGQTCPWQARGAVQYKAWSAEHVELFDPWCCSQDAQRVSMYSIWHRFGHQPANGQRLHGLLRHTKISRHPQYGRFRRSESNHQNERVSQRGLVHGNAVKRCKSTTGVIASLPTLSFSKTLFLTRDLSSVAVVLFTALFTKK